MKKMKSLKQQLAAAISLILVVMTITACVPELAVAQIKGRVRAKHNGVNLVLGDGSVRYRNKAGKPRRFSYDFNNDVGFAKTQRQSSRLLKPRRYMEQEGLYK